MSHPDLQPKKRRVNDDRANSAPPRVNTNINLTWWDDAISGLKIDNEHVYHWIPGDQVDQALNNILHYISQDYSEKNFRIQQLEQIYKMTYENFQLYTKSDKMRIETLAEENKQLKDTLKNLENKLTIRYKKIHDKLLNGFNRDYNAMVKEKDKEIEELKKQLNMNE